MISPVAILTLYAMKAFQTDASEDLPILVDGAFSFDLHIEGWTTGVTTIADVPGTMLCW
jgi:hypothetical protein